METINITLGSRVSKIIVGEKLENLQAYLPGNKTVLITDDNVYRLYKDKFSKLETIVIGTTEKVKTLDTVKSIYEQLVDKELDRSGFIVGIGGGIVCDIVGFVASTYLRGVEFGFVSTTLLSQVDASIGGKNGVNLHGYKNMIGVFNQPKFVICEFNMLNTLPAEEFKNGFAEIIKHACIRNSDMFDFCEINYEKALKNDYETIYRMVYDSLIIKGKVVENDERESGERRILNFGHTYGHAIEKISGIPHGEAVSIGMVIASKISKNRGLLTENEERRIIETIKNYNLPIKSDLNPQDIFNAMKKDKKRQGDQINFVLLNGIGNAIIEKVSLNELENLY